MFGWFRKKPTVVLRAPENKDIPDQLLPSGSEQVVHLGVVVGHTKLSGGAVLDGASKLSEYQYGLKVVEAMKKAMDKFPRLQLSVFLRDDIGIAGAYDQARGAGCDCVVELHFNSASGKSTGSLTLTTPDPKDVAFANMQHWYMCEAFGRDGNSRGVLSIGRSVRGAGNVYAFNEGANCLLEPFFGDKEAELGLKKVDAYAYGILKATQEWATKQGLI